MKYKYEMIKDSKKEAIFEDAINCMISALEYRDLYTKGHSHRVGEMSAFCAKRLNMRPIDIFYIEIAGQLHDIGKIGISDDVLLKNGRLNDMEWREMKRHPAISADIVSEAGQLGELAEVVYQHHERWDGKGYPDGLKETEIKLGGRILALCDALDAMASNRAYRPSLTWDKIKDELYNNLGTQFDPSFEFLMSELVEFWIENFESKYDNVMQNNMQIENLMDQHQRIRELIDKIQTIVNDEKVDHSAKIIVQSIKQLAGLLRLHLSSEDRYLYPALLNSDNAEIKDLVVAFDERMGGLSNAVIFFKTKYNTSRNIENNFDTFKIELSDILEKLITRLNREDKELYPLLD